MKENINNALQEVAKAAAEMAFDEGYLKALRDIKSAIGDSSITMNKDTIEFMIKNAENTFKK